MFCVRLKLPRWLKRRTLWLRKSTDKKSNEGTRTRTVDPVLTPAIHSNHLYPSQLLRLPTELLLDIIEVLNNIYLADLPRGGDPLLALRL